MRIKLIILAFLFFFFAVNPVSAASSVIINEIMYDLPGSDTDHEWVELNNTGNDPITIIGGSTNGAWRINDGTNHILSTTPAQGGMTIPSGDFAIIAKNSSVFLTDYPSFSGTVIQSSISLNNTGTTVSLRIDSDGAFFDEFSYQNTLGAAGDGNSLQRKSDGSWIAAFPTPGSQNANDPPPPTPTPTPIPSPTPTPTSSPTPTKTPSPTPTPKKTAASTNAPTPTPKNTPIPSSSKTENSPQPKSSNEISYRIASVAGAEISTTPEAKVEVKGKKQINPFLWVGIIFIFAGIGAVGYIYLQKNGKIPF